MDPGSMTAALNDEICRAHWLDEEDFFTAVNAEIDHETMMMRFVSAGHPPLMLIRGENVLSLPGDGDGVFNLPVGVQEGWRFSGGEIKLQPGDKLLFYSDGLTEMPMEKRNRFITYEELKEVVFDFGKVSHIGSAGIGKFLLFYKDVSISGCSLRLENVPRPILELFKVVRLDSLFKISGA